MMKFKGALIKEQGVTFAIIVVNPNTFNSSGREHTRLIYSSSFGGVPTVLVTVGSNGKLLYHGREDIVNFLATLSPQQIPWKDFRRY